MGVAITWAARNEMRGEESVRSLVEQRENGGAGRHLRHVRKVMRIGWNVLALSETARRYPDRAHELLWRWLSVRRKGTRLWLSYGRYLYARSRARRGPRPVCEHTFFFRNPVQFEVLADIACAWPAGAAMRIASIGCSTGAELYSAVWTIRRARPDCRVAGLGADVSDASLDAARLARYPRSAFELQRLAVEDVERLCADGLFEADGDALVVRPAVRDGVRWRRASVLDPAFVDDVAPQDVVFANNMLCHFENARAEAALRNLAAILAPGGYLFMYGVDPDLKTRVIRALGLRPRLERIRELYEGDGQVLQKWPSTHYGAEPFSDRERDWTIRYGTVFQRAAD